MLLLQSLPLVASTPCLRRVAECASAGCGLDVPRPRALRLLAMTALAPVPPGRTQALRAREDAAGAARGALRAQLGALALRCEEQARALHQLRVRSGHGRALAASRMRLVWPRRSQMAAPSCWLMQTLLPCALRLGLARAKVGVMLALPAYSAPTPGHGAARGRGACARFGRGCNARGSCPWWGQGVFSACWCGAGHSTAGS